MNFATKLTADATHVIDDGGCLYWVAAPEMTADEVADAFRVGYDGQLGAFEVTNLATETVANY